MQQQQQQQQQYPGQQQAQMMPPTQVYMQPGGVQLTAGGGVMPAGYMTVAPVRQPDTAESYLSHQSKGLGITLIVVGVLAFIFNGVGFAVNDYLAAVGHGFWCGALFILTGAFGVAAANKKRCLIVTFMILAIKSAIITICLLGFGLGGAVNNSCNSHNYYYSYSCYDHSSYYCRACSGAAVAMESLLAILAVVAAIASIWGSAICCRAVCCCGYTPTYGVVLAAPYGNQQVMIISQQQQQPMGTQYARPQVLPMPVGPPAYTAQAPGYPQPQPQYWAAPSPNQPPHLQQQLQQQQQGGYIYASAPADDGLSSGVAMAAMAPPAYSALNQGKTADLPGY